MKSKIILLFTALTMNLAYGQATTEISNAEKFSLESGTLIQKDFTDVGTIKKVEVQVLRYIDLISSESVSAIRFKYTVSGSYSSDTKIASLDADEIDELIQAIKIIQEKVFPSIPTAYTEVIYKSRGGFQAGCYWHKNDWSAFIQLQKHDNKSLVFLEKEDFPRLLVLLEKAKTKL